MNTRLSRVNELLKRELGNIVQKDLDLPKGTLTTITHVEAFPNLQGAKVYVSVLPEPQTQEVFRILKENVYDVQQVLNKRLNMRPVPKIQWVEDADTPQIQRVEELLEQIKKKG